MRWADELQIEPQVIRKMALHFTGPEGAHGQAAAATERRLTIYGTSCDEWAVSAMSHAEAIVRTIAPGGPRAVREALVAWKEAIRDLPTRIAEEQATNPHLAGEVEQLLATGSMLAEMSDPRMWMAVGRLDSWDESDGRLDRWDDFQRRTDELRDRVDLWTGVTPRAPVIFASPAWLAALGLTGDDAGLYAGDPLRLCVIADRGEFDGPTVAHELLHEACGHHAIGDADLWGITEGAVEWMACHVCGLDGDALDAGAYPPARLLCGALATRAVAEGHAAGRAEWICGLAKAEDVARYISPLFPEATFSEVSWSLEKFCQVTGEDA